MPLHIDAVEGAREAARGVREWVGDGRPSELFADPLGKDRRSAYAVQDAGNGVGVAHRSGLMVESLETFGDRAAGAQRCRSLGRAARP